MLKIQLENRENRVQKIPLTTLFKSELGLPLDEAKYLTDRLLETGIVEITCEANAGATSFMQKASSLGVICKVVRE